MPPIQIAIDNYTNPVREIAVIIVAYLTAKKKQRRQTRARKIRVTGRRVPSWFEVPEGLLRLPPWQCLLARRHDLVCLCLIQYYYFISCPVPITSVITYLINFYYYYIASHWVINNNSMNLSFSLNIIIYIYSYQCNYMIDVIPYFISFVYVNFFLYSQFIIIGKERHGDFQNILV